MCGCTRVKLSPLKYWNIRHAFIVKTLSCSIETEFRREKANIPSIY